MSITKSKDKKKSKEIKRKMKRKMVMTPISEISEFHDLMGIAENRLSDIFKSCAILTVQFKKTGFSLNKVEPENVMDSLQIFRDSVKYSNLDLDFIIKLFSKNDLLFRSKLDENIQDHENPELIREFIEKFTESPTYTVVTVMEIPDYLCYLKIYINIINCIGIVSNLIDDVRSIFITEYDSRGKNVKQTDYFNFLKLENQINNINDLLLKMYV